MVPGDPVRGVQRCVSYSGFLYRLHLATVDIGVFNSGFLAFDQVGERVSNRFSSTSRTFRVPATRFCGCFGRFLMRNDVDFCLSTFAEEE